MEEQEDIPNVAVKNEPVVQAKPEPQQPQPQTQSQPDLSQVMQNNPVNPPSVISYKKKKGFIDYFIYFVSAVAFLVWVAVIALYFQNKESKETVEKVAEVASPTVTLIPEKKYNITTKNGNVININENGDEEVVVNKGDYESTGISGFIKVSVSPNKKKLCFESWPPSPQPAIYISDIEGAEVSKINANMRNCYWSGDSSKLVYNDVKSEKEATNLFIYDIDSASETLLTVHTATESARPKLHTAVGWSADDKKVLCQYSYQKTPQEVRECEVELETKFVNYF